MLRTLQIFCTVGPRTPGTSLAMAMLGINFLVHFVSFILISVLHSYSSSLTLLIDLIVFKFTFVQFVALIKIITYLLTYLRHIRSFSACQPRLWYGCRL